MSMLRTLIIEDEQNWHEGLVQVLQRLGGQVHVEIAQSYDEARSSITNESFDLAIVDLALSGAPTDPHTADQLGMDLLRELRNSPHNGGCGLLVLTAYPTTARVRQALREHEAHDVIEKAEFDAQSFVETARSAIRTARLRQAKTKARRRYRLVVRLNQDHLVGSDLSGPDRRSTNTPPAPVRLETHNLARRTDNLNLLILKGEAGAWRYEALALGKEIYQVLDRDRRIMGDLMAARGIAPRRGDLCLQFSGPAVSLGFPFELLHDENDYLGLDHILTRQLIQIGPNLSRKPEPFYAFLEERLKRQEPLRVLIVGANTDGRIPAAEQEAQTLADSITANLQKLGIACEVTLLVGVQATYTKTSHALSTGRYHIFHYAGHGRYNDHLPEISGLILHDGTLTAAALSQLVRDTDLRLVFLSCCLSARTAADTQHGDFHGVLEALVRADVPIVLGYRWAVADEPARQLALTFYSELWRTFTPGEALFHARRNATLSTRGRDDDTWAAPVLIVQNE